MPSTQGPAPDHPRCRYPRSHATARDIHTELASVAANAGGCTSCYLDTVESMSVGIFERGNHHQGLARTHRLSDGSITFFLAHSELGGQGSVSSYRYAGPTDGEHILDADPLAVATMEKLEPLDEPHPADICFLPEVDDRDAGYLFVTEEFDRRFVSVYRWEPSRGPSCTAGCGRASRTRDRTCCSSTGWAISTTWGWRATTGDGARR